MKTTKIITTLTVIALLINTATAQPINKPTVPLPPEALTVKYLGADDEYLIFEISISSNSDKHSVLNIADETAGQLYSETFKGNTTTRKFKIEKTENQNLRFELVSGKNEYTKTFNVNTSVVLKTTVEEGAIVTRY